MYIHVKVYKVHLTTISFGLAAVRISRMQEDPLDRSINSEWVRKRSFIYLSHTLSLLSSPLNVNRGQAGGSVYIREVSCKIPWVLFWQVDDRETDGSRSFRVYSSRDEEWKAFYLTRTLVPLFFSTDFAPWVLENPFGRMGPAAKTPALLGQGINVKNLRGKDTPIPKPPRGGYPRNLFYIFRSWPIIFFFTNPFFYPLTREPTLPGPWNRVKRRKAVQAKRERKSVEM